MYNNFKGEKVRELEYRFISDSFQCFHCEYDTQKSLEAYLFTYFESYFIR